MTAPVLAVEGVSLAFGGVNALTDVTFSIGPRQTFAVIGPNGAGKSSLLNVLTGIYRPQQGSVHLNGTPILGKPAAAIARLGLSRTFQNLGLFDSMSVLDNVLVGRAPRLRSGLVAGSLWWGRSRREEVAARRHGQELLDLFELGDQQDAEVGALPYGTKKRVELAKALANDPKLLLLDEPVAGMNPEESARIAETITLARTEIGASVLLIEHDLPMVMRLADTVMVLDFGQCVAQGTPDEVQADPEVLRAYTGDLGPRAASRETPR
jgi:branched-chain amino acid transport system ATP-binding protein